MAGVVGPATPSLFELDARAAPPGPLVRVRATMGYDGAAFHGFAAQPGIRTVAGTLTAALERVLRHPVVVTGAGRTDRGVHANAQVVSFDASAATLAVVPLLRILNKLCGPSIAVYSVAEAPAGFDARFSALARRYRYTVLNRPVHDPLLAQRVWHVARPLDLNALRLAADPLVGVHDFSSFCKRVRKGDGAVVSAVRRVDDAVWRDLGDGLLRFDIEAPAFCHQMVRSIVGLLMDVGLGRRRPADVLTTLNAHDRATAGSPAPPRGLCLWSIRYADGWSG